MSKYRIPRERETQPHTPATARPARGSYPNVPVVAGAGWLVALALLVALVVSRGGCTLDWPSLKPAPIAEPGLRALFVDESEHGKLADALADKELRAYLDSHCAKGPEGKPEWRNFDPDRNTEYDGKIWQDVFKRPRESLPWLVCSNGKAGYEGPCPTVPEEVLVILKRYGGP